ncbi:YbbR family protein, partial [human gut metagenome]
TSATPTQLTVTGREEMIDSVTEIQTEPIDVSGATETVQGNYNLVLPNGVNSNTTTVRVKVEIQKKVLNGGYFFSTILLISDLTVTATRRFIILIISFL